MMAFTIKNEVIVFSNITLLLAYKWILSIFPDNVVELGSFCCAFSKFSFIWYAFMWNCWRILQSSFIRLSSCKKILKLHLQSPKESTPKYTRIVLFFLGWPNNISQSELCIQQKFIFSKFWKLEFKLKVWTGLVSSGASILDL